METDPYHLVNDFISYYSDNQKTREQKDDFTTKETVLQVSY